MLKAISDAYTLDDCSSLRLHPTLSGGQVIEYRPATLHGLVLMPNGGSRMLIALPAVPDAPMTSVAAEPSPVHVQEPGVQFS